MSRNLIERIVTGIIIVIYVMVLIYVRSWFLWISTTAIACMSVYELSLALRKAGFQLYTWPAYATCLLAPIMVSTIGGSGLIALMSALVLLTLCMLLKSTITLRDVMASILLCVYTPLCCALLLRLGSIQSEGLSRVLLALVYATSWGSDMFAYFIGSFFGKHQLVPRISPKKTVEGAVGGLLGSIVISLLIGGLASVLLQVEIAWIHYILLGIIGSLSAQVGDLVASAIKRECEIKDYGSFFPGHGGIMDRMDGTFFTITAIIAYGYVLGWIV